MNIQFSKENETDIVAISGRIDTTNAAELEKAVAPLWEKEKAAVIFECKDMEYISSSGLRVLLKTHKTLTGKGGTFAIRNLVREVRNIIDLTGFSKILTIY